MMSKINPRENTTFRKIIYSLILITAVLTPQVSLPFLHIKKAVLSSYDIVILISVPIAIYVYLTYKPKNIFKSSLVKSIVLFLAVSLLSALCSYFVWKDFNLVFSSILNWLRLFEIFAPFFIIIFLGIDKKDLRFFLNLIIFLGILSSLIGFTYLGKEGKPPLLFSKDIYRGLFQTVNWKNTHYRRNPGSFGDANFFALFINFLLFILLYLKLPKDKKMGKKILNHFLIGFFFFSFLLTVSKSGLLVLSIGLILSLFFSFRQTLIFFVELVFWFFLLYIVIPFPKWLNYQLGASFESIFKIFDNTFGLLTEYKDKFLAKTSKPPAEFAQNKTVTANESFIESSESISVASQNDTESAVSSQKSADVARKIFKGKVSGAKRFKMWGEAFQIFIYSPIIGIGFELSKYVSDYSGFHNYYLSILTETGLLGFIALIFLLISTIRFLWKIQEKKKGQLLDLSRLLLIWFILMILQSFVHGSLFYWRTASVFWFFIGTLYYLFNFEKS